LKSEGENLEVFENFHKKHKKVIDKLVFYGKIVTESNEKGAKMVKNPPLE